MRVNNHDSRGGKDPLRGTKGSDIEQQQGDSEQSPSLGLWKQNASFPILATYGQVILALSSFQLLSGIFTTDIPPVVLGNLQ